MRNEERKSHLKRFYAILGELECKIGGARTLADHSWQKGLPDFGIYFFQEHNETRTDTGETGDELRVVRVGIVEKDRLEHRLKKHGSGGFACPSGSVFRDYVHTSLKNAEGRDESERKAVIGAMPFLWLEEVDLCKRLRIECNSIALLSNYCRKSPLDRHSQGWLGKSSDKTEVRQSGLWCVNHVKERYSPEFLDTLERSVTEMRT